jgi:hypothetical protein
MEIERRVIAQLDKIPSTALMRAIALVKIQGKGQGILMPLASKGDLGSLLRRNPGLPMTLATGDALHIARLYLRACVHAEKLVSPRPSPKPKGMHD